jgi:hypothetical protein
MSLWSFLPPVLTRLRLVLRLAAGQNPLRVARLFGLEDGQVLVRLPALRPLVSGLRGLAALPFETRFNRLALAAHLKLQAAMQAGERGAQLFHRWSWSWNEDPAQRLAALVEALLARVARVEPGRPRWRDPATPRPQARRRQASPGPRLAHDALRFALTLRDRLVVEQGRTLLEERVQRALARRPWRPDRRTYVPVPPWWVTARQVRPQEPATLWAPLDLPEAIPRPPPQGIPPHGRHIWCPSWRF